MGQLIQVEFVLDAEEVCLDGGRQALVVELLEDILIKGGIAVAKQLLHPEKEVGRLFITQLFFGEEFLKPGCSRRLKTGQAGGLEVFIGCGGVYSSTDDIRDLGKDVWWDQGDSMGELGEVLGDVGSEEVAFQDSKPHSRVLAAEHWTSEADSSIGELWVVGGHRDSVCVMQAVADVEGARALGATAAIEPQKVRLHQVERLSTRKVSAGEA